MRCRLFAVAVLLMAPVSWAQQSSAPGGSGQSASAPSVPDQKPSQSKDDGSAGASQPESPLNPHLEPPRSDRVDASALPDGESSSKDTQIDLSPPPGDDKAHGHTSDVLMDEGSGKIDSNPVRYWDPHKAAKDVEVGDFYFKRKNYKAAEDRYREALFYKNNDAIATFRLAVCLDKMDRPDDARTEYEAYLNILPHGPEAEKAEKAIARLKTPTEKARK